MSRLSALLSFNRMRILLILILYRDPFHAFVLQIVAHAASCKLFSMHALPHNCSKFSVRTYSYDQAKEAIQGGVGLAGVPLHFAASTTSGFCYSVASLPIDLAKSRMQTQASQPNLLYRSIPQTLITIARNDGLRALWSGFTPYFARCGGHTIAMFIALEQIKKVL